MQETSLSHKAAFAERSAQLEQQWRRLGALLARVPLERWQWLIMLLLVIWLSHSVARFFWLVIPSPAIAPASVSQVPMADPAAMANAPSNVNIDQISNLSPFGDNAQPAEMPDVQPQVATQGIEDGAGDTQLNLVLRGVLASNQESAARAIIASGDRADVYGIGDTLPVGNNVTLAKVLDLRVILNNNGNYESLWMYKDDPNAPKLATPVAQMPASDWSRTNGYSEPPYQQQPMRVDRSAGYDSPRQMHDQAAAEMGKTLADVVAMSIYRENGQVVGYKIRPGRNAELFNSLGLQADDIVTAVNGVPLSSPGKIMEIYKSMGSATSANLEIRRGGSSVNLDVMLK